MRGFCGELGLLRRVRRMQRSGVNVKPAESAVRDAVEQALLLPQANDEVAHLPLPVDGPFIGHLERIGRPRIV